MATVEYCLFRVKFILPAQSSWLHYPITPKDIFIASVEEKPDSQVRSGYTWHLGNIAMYDPISYDIVWVTEPKRHNERLDRQGGCFVLSGNSDKRFADALDLPVYGACEFIKYVVDKSLYKGIFALLRKMNVTSKSVYGDLNGLARGIRMEMQVYANA